MKTYIVYDEELGMEHGMACDTETEANHLRSILQETSAANTYLIKVFNSNDEYKQHILNGGYNWYIVLDSAIGRISSDPCPMYEVEPEFYDGIFHGTSRHNEAEHAIQTLYEMYLQYCEQNRIEPTDFHDF